MMNLGWGSKPPFSLLEGEWGIVLGESLFHFLLAGIMPGFYGDLHWSPRDDKP